MRTISILFCLFALTACDELSKVVGTIPTGTAPTKSEISKGIREALIIGAENSVQQTSQSNGFYNNGLIRIPFPPEAKKVEETARDLGLDRQVENFVKTLNRGAEQASAKATPIFVNAIRQMTLQDVYEIWQGNDDAATRYLQKTTSAQLKNEFRPIVVRTLDEVELTRYWNPLVSAYNKLPFGDKVNPNLDEYVLDQTMEGLFTMIAQEEKKIRENPAARVTDLLRKVFGYQDKGY